MFTNKRFHKILKAKILKNGPCPEVWGPLASRRRHCQSDVIAQVAKVFSQYYDIKCLCKHDKLELISLGWNKLDHFQLFHTTRFSQYPSGPTSTTSPDAAPLTHSTFLPPGGFHPRPGLAAPYGSRHNLVHSQRARTKEAAATIEMEQHIPLLVWRGATREDEDAILIHP